jgi:S1-C subfamily serine protease
VYAKLSILKGSRAGTTLILSRQEVRVGRHPDNDIRFDPQSELKVSARHALIFRHGEAWYVQDLGSRNGTLINGRPIADPTALRDGDRIEFGRGGPVVDFHSLPAPALREAPRSAQGPPATETVPVPGPGTDSTALPPSVQAQVEKETRRLRALVGLLAAALIVVVLAALWATRVQRSRWESAAAEMEERIDSILEASTATARALEGRLQGLNDALVQSQQNLRSLREQLEAADVRGDSAEIGALRAQLLEAHAALLRHELAANIDYDRVEAANRAAIAKVFVEYDGGEVFTATAFAVRPDATLLTNRHVVTGQDGSRRPRRLAVQFADSDQVWPARVVATSRTDDLAVLRVQNILGETPTIQGFNTRPDTIQPGTAVAVIGFPLGAGDPGSGSVARTTMTAGILSSMEPDLIRIDGYGVEGTSGSPILDGDGQVIGILFGGSETSGGRTLVAVPATRALVLLRGAG